MCCHRISCPPAHAPNARAARIVAAHHEQGWVLLCNGVVLFDDGGVISPAVDRADAAATPTAA